MKEYNSTRVIEIQGPIDKVVRRIENNYLDDDEINELFRGRDITLQKSDVANFIAYSLITVDECDDDTNNRLDSYFENYHEILEDKEKYQAKQFFDTKYVIVFSEARKGIVLDMLQFFLDFAPEYFTTRNINISAIVKTTLRIVFRCIKKMDSPLQKCVFHALLESKRRVFRPEDIYTACFNCPDNNDPRRCDRLKYICGKRNHDQTCGISIKDIEEIFGSFKEKQIIRPKGDGWEVIP